MRLRRETGDYTLVFDWTKEQYECQIRKGLGVEDLVGAIVTHIDKSSDNSPTITAVVPIVRASKMDTSATITGFMCASADGSMDTIVYDPETGIATYRPRG